MAYTKTTWKDRLVQRPRTYFETTNSDGSITHVPSEGAITEAGTPVNALNLNKLENGLEAVSVAADTLRTDVDGHTTELTAVSEQLADIGNKYYIVSALAAEADATARLQGYIDDLAVGDTLELRGYFNVTYLAFLELRGVRICGKATINYLVNAGSACFDIYDAEDVEIDGLTFTGLKGKSGAPTTYTDNKNYLVKVGAAKNVKIHDCKFYKHLGRCIQVNSVKGTWADQGVLISKNWFEEMADLNSNEQTCVCLEAGAQYSTVENNTFVDVKGAVKSYGANNRIEDNNVTASTLDVAGSVSGYIDLIGYKQGHIIACPKSESDNQSKCVIRGNKCNHLSGNAPVIMTIGNVGTNENYNDILNNELLVNTVPYPIIIANCSGSKVLGNSIGSNPPTGVTAFMVLYHSELINIDSNYFIGDTLTAVIDKSSFVEGDNKKRFKSLSSHYQYINSVGGYSNARYAKDELTFAFINDGSVADWLTTNGFSTSRLSTGVYRVTHNLGHVNYIPSFTISTSTKSDFTIQDAERDVNYCTINVYDKAGNAVDCTITGRIVLTGDRIYNDTNPKW